MLIVDTFGTALPALALAGGVAFLAGGIGNAYTTHATSDGQATNKDLATSFIIGGAANLLSFRLSMIAAAPNMEGICVRGTMDCAKNIKVGTGIAIATSVATSIGTTNFPGKRSAEVMLRHKLSVKEKRLSL